MVTETPCRIRRALEKLVSFHRRIATIIRFASSPRMRQTFFSGELKITVAQCSRPAPQKWPSDEQEWQSIISAILEKHGLERITNHKAKYDEQKIIKTVAGFGEATTVHCECALVSSLESSGPPNVFSYVGISKLSCKPCHNWLKAYNYVTGNKFRTRGSHDKFYRGWAMPALVYHDNQAKVDALFLSFIEEEFCQKFCDKNIARTGRASDSSASSETMIPRCLPGPIMTKEEMLEEQRMLDYAPLMLED